jgi:hypothetical protein
MGLGWVVKIIIMKIYDSGKFLPADVLGTNYFGRQSQLTDIKL